MSTTKSLSHVSYVCCFKKQSPKITAGIQEENSFALKKKDCFTKRPRHVFAENVTPCHASLLSLKVIMIKWAAFKIWNGGWTFLLIEGLFDSIQDKNTQVGYIVNFEIFLSPMFYMKSILEIQEVQNQAFQHIWRFWIVIFMIFCTFWRLRFIKFT